MLVETVLAIFGVTPIYLPDDYIHPQTGYQCNMELGGYYSRSESQIYVCEGQGEFVVYHELGHYFFEELMPELHVGVFKRYVDHLQIPNEYELSDFVYYHELFAMSFSRVLRKKESIIEYEKDLDILTRKLLILYFQEHYGK